MSLASFLALADEGTLVDRTAKWYRTAQWKGISNDGTTTSVANILAAACLAEPSCVGFHLHPGNRLGTGALLYDSATHVYTVWPPETPDPIAAAGGAWEWGEEGWSGEGEPADAGSVAAGKGWNGWLAFRRLAGADAPSSSAGGCCQVSEEDDTAACYEYVNGVCQVLRGRTIGCNRGVWKAEAAYDGGSGRCVAMAPSGGGLADEEPPPPTPSHMPSLLPSITWVTGTAGGDCNAACEAVPDRSCFVADEKENWIQTYDEAEAAATAAGLKFSTIVERCDMGEVPLWEAASSQYRYCADADDPSQRRTGASRCSVAWGDRARVCPCTVASTPTPSGGGEELCEGHGYGREECERVGCCQFAACSDGSGRGACHSNVGDGACAPTPFASHVEDGSWCAPTVLEAQRGVDWLQVRWAESPTVQHRRARMGVWAGMAVALFAVALAVCLAKRVARARRSTPQAAVAIPADLEARSSVKPASAGEGPAALPSKGVVVVQGEPPSYQASVIHAIGLGF